MTNRSSPVHGARAEPPWYRRHPVALFFVLAFGRTWLVWVPRAAHAHGLLSADWAVGVGQVWTYGPAVAALLAAALGGGRRDVRDLGSRLVRWRVDWRWYVVVLAGPPAFSLVVAGLFAALGGSWSAAVSPAIADWRASWPALIAYFVILALTDGLGEETGWRGFALPRLLTGHNAMIASLGLGVVWAMWHLPLFWTAGAALEGRSIVLLLLTLPALSVLYTWIFKHTRGSLLLAVLFHAASNLWGIALLPAAAEDATPALLRTGATWLLALAVIAADHMTRPAPPPGANREWLHTLSLDSTHRERT